MWPRPAMSPLADLAEGLRGKRLLTDALLTSPSSASAKFCVSAFRKDVTKSQSRCVAPLTFAVGHGLVSTGLRVQCVGAGLELEHPSVLVMGER